MCDVAIILFRILNNYRLGRCLLLRGLFLYRLFEKLILIIDNLFGLFFLELCKLIWVGLPTL